MKDESGFTLIELLVVVAFIGILATMALSNFAMFKGQALSATAASDARALVPAADAASDDPPSFKDYHLTGAGGTDGLEELATKFGGRYSPNTFGTIRISAQHYEIMTYQPGMNFCYFLVDGAISTGACL